MIELAPVLPRLPFLGQRNTSETKSGAEEELTDQKKQ
jgi:hypothetical protein